jgi:predicted  nucleic acid-binding Zn-ribbon protein
MSVFGGLCALTLLVSASAAVVQVTPIEKVISLIEDLKSEVETDGQNEASEYNKFACFCKDTTLEKSTSVKDSNDKIDVLSADIADKTQEKKEDASELAERKVDQEKHKADLQATTVRCAKEKAEYEAEAADLSKAIMNLKDAIKALKDSKPAAFLAIKGAVADTILMAEVLGKGSTSAKRKAVLNMLQQGNGVDPADPEYKYHSDDIIDVCDKLLEEYTASKKDLDAEYAKTSKACADMKKSLKEKIEANQDAMDTLEANIEKLTKEIAQHRQDLITEDAQMKDDELYLKDLQARCEDRANDYDQRSSLRNDELSAITEALEILTKDRCFKSSWLFQYSCY